MLDMLKDHTTPYSLSIYSANAQIHHKRSYYHKLYTTNKHINREATRW